MTPDKRRVLLSPSMMCADLLHLAAELDLLQQWGVDFLHVDVTDGHYVPNFTLGPDFCRRLAGYSSIPLDVHLMIEDADRFIPLFAEAAAGPGGRGGSGTSRRRAPALFIHPETSWHPLHSLALVRDCGARPGIVLDPGLPVQAVRALLPHVALVCLMAVNPGFAGQKLVPGTMEKIAELAAEIRGRGLAVQIQVDGNVSWENIPHMLEAGAEILVLGSSSLFEAGGDLAGNLRRLYALVGRDPPGAGHGP